MIRAKLWFRCAGAFNPVTPTILRPAVIGWKAKDRPIQFSLERAFNGEELLMRMKGWVTADVRKVVEIVKKHGGEIRLKTRVAEYHAESNRLALVTNNGNYRCRNLINCAGLYSDRVAKMCGVNPGLKIKIIFEFYFIFN